MAEQPDTASVARYCLCGGALRCTSTPSALANRVAGMFDLIHRGAGHGSATAALAARVRRREEADRG